MFAGVLRPFRAEHSILQKSEKKRDRHSRQSAYCLIEQRGYSAITPDPTSFIPVIPGGKLPGGGHLAAARRKAGRLPSDR